MKTGLRFIALCALVLQCFAVELDPAALQKLQEFAAKCQTKTKATQEDMAKLMQHEVPETKTAKCFMACMKKELGFMNPDNSMNADMIRSKMEAHLKDAELKEKGIKIIEMCQKEVEVDPDECEMAAKLMACCVKHTKEMGIENLSLMGNK